MARAPQAGACSSHASGRSAACSLSDKQLSPCARSSAVQAYASAVKHLQRALNLSSGQVLDLRGNHDAFDVPQRCGSLLTSPAA